MQIILASAKIMNDRSATKGDACQSKKVKSSPDISLSSPRFQNEADCIHRTQVDTLDILQNGIHIQFIKKVGQQTNIIQIELKY